MSAYPRRFCVLSARVLSTTAVDGAAALAFADGIDDLIGHVCRFVAAGSQDPDHAWTSARGVPLQFDSEE